MSAKFEHSPDSKNNRGIILSILYNLVLICNLLGLWFATYTRNPNLHSPTRWEEHSTPESDPLHQFSHQTVFIVMRSKQWRVSMSIELFWVVNDLVLKGFLDHFSVTAEMFSLCSRHFRLCAENRWRKEMCPCVFLRRMCWRVHCLQERTKILFRSAESPKVLCMYNWYYNRIVYFWWIFFVS